jgi:hypothetical protein
MGTLLLISGCASKTSLSSQWIDSSQRNPRFERVIVVAVSSNPDRRRTFEDAVAKDLQASGIDVWPSTRLMNPELEVTRESLLPFIEERQAQAIIVTRVTGLEVETVEIEGRSNVQEERQQSGLDYVPPRKKGTVFQYDFSEDVEATRITSTYTTELTTEVYTAEDYQHIYTIVSSTSGQETLAEVIDVLSDEIAERLSKDKVIR